MHRHRLQHAMLGDRVGKLLQSLGFELVARLVRVFVNLLNGQHQGLAALAVRVCPAHRLIQAIQRVEPVQRVKLQWHGAASARHQLK